MGAKRAYGSDDYTASVLPEECFVNLLPARQDHTQPGFSRLSTFHFYSIGRAYANINIDLTFISNIDSCLYCNFVL